ncbi:MAG: biotin synthase BioB [Puniceicoccales bacterium]|jgi:biotin synthase|nr:biotin synthase BioB [Puniceicoccales bacterium]
MLTKKVALNIARDWSNEKLFQKANALREKYFGNKIHLCGIINARSGICDMDCKFCSQSSFYKTQVNTYKFLENETLRKKIQEVLVSGANKCGIVTSGGKLGHQDVESLAQVLNALSDNDKQRLCGSLGRLSLDDLKKLKQNGLTRFHHNLETSENFYPKICTTQRWKDRLATVKNAQKVGLETCVGGIFGCGETWVDRLDFAFELYKLKPNSVPINFLYRHKATPFENLPSLSVDEALRIIALFRLILQDISIRICGGRKDILGHRQYEIFRAGADAVMIGDYLTTSGESIEKDLENIKKLGLMPQG